MILDSDLVKHAKFVGKTILSIVLICFSDLEKYKMVNIVAKEVVFGRFILLMWLKGLGKSDAKNDT